MIAPQTIEQITNRIDIIDVVSEFVKLKKRGANYLGLCPFHNEKTPSFTVSPSKEIYKCFGCGRSGNTITFLMEHEKYSYIEALKWLAQRYNVEIQETEVSDETRIVQLAAESLHALNNFAQKFFFDQLLNTEEGQSNALTYLEERGYNLHTIEKFQLGYSPQKTVFATAALQQQFSNDILLKSGLVVNRNDDLVDNYRGRIIFPIHNTTGKIIGFGARVIGSADKAPKYINTPENEIYVKSKILYGAYFARHAIDKANECLLVEGYTDVISLHQAGIENVVASGGTSLTTDQLRIIKKYTANLTIIYDGDAAGVKAAMRGLDMALEEGLNVKLVLIPGNEDPDSYLKKIGAPSFQKFIAGNKKDFILFQSEILLKEAGNDISKKNDAVNVIAESLSKLNKAEDFTKKQEYIHQCASILKIDEGGLINLVNKLTQEKIEKDKKIFSGKEANFYNAISKDNNLAIEQTIDFFIDDQFYERELIRVLIEHGKELINGNKISNLINEAVNEYELHDVKLIAIFNLYFDEENKIVGATGKFMIYALDADLNKVLIGLVYFSYEFSDWSKIDASFAAHIDKYLDKTVASAINHYKLKKMQRLYLELRDELKNSKTESQYIQIIKVYSAMKKIEMEIAKQTETVYTGFKW